MCEVPNVVAFSRSCLESCPSGSCFLKKTFGSVCGEENVIWFRNWGALKSVHAVEHFHVMLFDPPEGFVRQVTGGDVSLAEKVMRGEVSL